MYRRPILCTLYDAVDFLKVLKIAIGDGDMWYYVPVEDGWEEVLGRNVYITSQYLFPNAKDWAASSGNWTRAARVAGGHST